MFFLVIAAYSILFVEDPNMKALGLGIAALGFILPKILEYQRNQQSAPVQAANCPPHKWTYNEAFEMSCNICKKRPGLVE